MSLANGSAAPGPPFLSRRLGLQLIGPAEARRIVSGTPGVTDRWHPEYPLEDELVLLQELADSRQQDPVFGLYLIRMLADGLAVGGIGFFGPPGQDRSVEIGYGLVEAVRGSGLATEAVGVAVRIAGQYGATLMKADTAVGNVPSQRVLEKSGFSQVSRSADLFLYERRLTG